VSDHDEALVVVVVVAANDDSEVWDELFSGPDIHIRTSMSLDADVGLLLLSTRSLYTF
jgi:hypothetical protein